MIVAVVMQIILFHYSFSIECLVPGYMEHRMNSIPSR